jgi:hypothetical protein
MTNLPSFVEWHRQSVSVHWLELNCSGRLKGKHHEAGREEVRDASLHYCRWARRVRCSAVGLATGLAGLRSSSQCANHGQNPTRRGRSPRRQVRALPSQALEAVIALRTSAKPRERGTPSNQAGAPLPRTTPHIPEDVELAPEGLLWSFAYST